MTRVLVTAILLLPAFGSITASAADDATAELHPRVQLETTLGNIVLELDAEKAPLTVVNFVDYVNAKFYDGTLFHRVIPDGLIQGGARTADMRKKTDGLRDAVKSESGNGLTNVRGSIAMVRRLGYPDSAVAEFFINVGATNTGLDKPLPDGAAYAVFGRVVEGLNVVDKISAVTTGPHKDFAAGLSKVVPVEPIVITSVKLQSPFDRRKALAVSEAAERKIREEAEKAKLAAEKTYRDRLAAIEKRAGAKLTTTESGLKYVDSEVGHGAPPNHN